MIRVQLEERTVETGARNVVAALVVDGDGTPRFEGDERAFPIYLQVLVAGDGEQVRRVSFEEDPATWARNLDSVLRTGYLVPVITHDDASAAAELR
jgi:hypothetical protein